MQNLELCDDRLPQVRIDYNRFYAFRYYGALDL